MQDLSQDLGAALLGTARCSHGVPTAPIRLLPVKPLK